MQERSWPARETSPREEDARGRPGTSPQDGRGNPATKTPTLAKMVGSPLPPSPNSLTRAGIVHIVAAMNPADIIPRLCILLLLGAALSPCGQSLSAAPVPYSGKVAINGANFQGDAQFTFALRDAHGTTHWRNGADAKASVTLNVDRGLYVCLLGGNTMNDFPAGANRTIWGTKKAIAVPLPLERLSVVGHVRRVDTHPGGYKIS
jgi:hypothetical protein